jgi:hypothetical protein
LFLNAAERVPDDDGRGSAGAVEVLRDIQVPDQVDAKPIIEGHLLVVHPIAPGKCLVPSESVLSEGFSVREGQRANDCHAASSELQEIAPADIHARSVLTLI